MSTRVTGLPTPCLLVERDRLQANIDRMNARADELNVTLRPHVKTHKSVEIAALIGADAITVSTLREAEYFAAAGYTDILYAVSIVPGKMDQVLALNLRGANVQVLLDMPRTAMEVAEAAAAKDEVVEAWIEIDVDGHRAGLEPDDPQVMEIGRFLQQSPHTRLAGVLTHAGGAYDCSSLPELEQHAEQERMLCVHAAHKLRKQDIRSSRVSVGSTPTALTARALEGVTELRAGVYVFFDLFQAGLGVCNIDDIALSVLTTVISHKPSHRRLIVDAGGLALSKDRGTASQAKDCGYGLVAHPDTGQVIPGLQVSAANQEHGVIELPEGFTLDQFPVGSRLRILPNHACMTAAAHDHYHVVNPSGQILARWERCNHW